jgi:hypothetical protein
MPFLSRASNSPCMLKNGQLTAVLARSRSTSAEKRAGIPALDCSDLEELIIPLMEELQLPWFPASHHDAVGRRSSSG